MWIELPNFWIAVINIIGIPLCHLAIAWASTCLPAGMFVRPLPPKSTHDSAGYENFFHEKLFLVRYWKNLLPDAAPWFKGFAKGKLESTDHDYLQTFVCETRRGELSHWIQILAISLFIIWTPSPASSIIIIYAILANAPCIINLRYTRLRIIALIHKKYT
jgi:glycosyl-4,4'-diaponeurosporenoate acyltransferase